MNSPRGCLVSGSNAPGRLSSHLSQGGCIGLRPNLPRLLGPGWVDVGDRTTAGRRTHGSQGMVHKGLSTIGVLLILLSLSLLGIRCEKRNIVRRLAEVQGKTLELQLEATSRSIWTVYDATCVDGNGAVHSVSLASAFGGRRVHVQHDVVLAEEEKVRLRHKFGVSTLDDPAVCYVPPFDWPLGASVLGVGVAKVIVSFRFREPSELAED